jgi:tripartite-type tricarboxylate transporter receptor subunit TctC
MKKIIALVLTLITGSVLAWPTKDITLIVPYPPGGVNDQLARFMAPDLENILRVPVQIKNMPGAANSVAINYVITRDNDDHTFIITMDDFVLGPLYQGKHTYQNFQATNIIGRVPYVLFGSTRASTEQLRQQIQSKQTINVGDNGANGGAHLWITGLKSTVTINSIHYKGSTPVLTDVAGGHTEYGVSSIAASHQFIKDGRLIPLVTSGSQRSSVYPSVPTAREMGFRGPDSQTWFGIFARKGTTDSAIARFSDTVGLIVKNNARIQEFSNTGMNIVNLRGNRAAEFFQQEIQHFESIKNSKQSDSK